MKLPFIFLSCLYLVTAATAQTYPDPEFNNEICLLKKDSVYLAVRLEKNGASMDTKVKAAGFGGMENGYTIDEAKSPVRLTTGKDLFFIYTTGAYKASSTQTDSILSANQIDPSTMRGMGDFTDPSTGITLYKMESVKDTRKIYLQKSGGAFNGKIRSSAKYTLSIKKIREGYWLIVVDKPLPKGEYAFSMMDVMSGSSYDTRLFAFGVD